MNNFADKSRPTIIHIFSHNPNPVILKYKSPEDYISKHGKAGFVKLDKFPFWVGFFDDFNHKISVDTLERTEKYNLECWRPYWNCIKKDYEGIFEGIYHRVFPSSEFKIPKVDYWHWSQSLLDNLKKRIAKNEKILLHLHDGHSNFMTWLILNLKPLNIPVIYHHRGGWFANFNYKFKRKNPVYLLTYKKQKETLKYISHYFCGSKYELDFVRNVLNIKNSSYYMDGIDFNYFRPGDKIEARRKLGLSLDKKIILFVGRFGRLNGVDNLIDMFNKFKKNNINVELLLIGGYKNYLSYQTAKDAGAILIERVPEPKLRDYYQAADIYSLATSDFFYQTFAGFGITPVQALACGIPVLSNNIMNLPSSTEEINKIGRIFNSCDELYQQAVYMLNNIDEFKDCREIAKKYYDKNETMRILINKYDELFLQYYK